MSTDVIKRLEERIKKLLLRNELLTGLVRSAGLKIPADQRKKGRKAPKYANALSKEQQASAIAKELESMGRRPLAEQKVVKRKKGRPKRPSKKKPLNCLLLMSQPSSSCLILSKPPPKGKSTLKKHLRPLTPFFFYLAPQLRVLGTMVPVQPLFVVPSKGGARLPQNSPITCLPALRPSTTQANKVPIPALGVKPAARKRATPRTKRPKVAQKQVAPVNPLPEKAAEPPPPPPDREAPKSPKNLTLDLNLPPNELSNDIFASFQVPPGCQNAESTSPTAAFLLAFPLVSSGGAKGPEATESQSGTPNLEQMAKPAQVFPERLTPPLFDSFAFFNNTSTKEAGAGFYSCALEPPPQNTSSNINTGKSSFLGDGRKCQCHLGAGVAAPAKPKDQGKFAYKSCSNWEGDLFGDSCATYGPKGATKPSINWMATPSSSAPYKPADYFLDAQFPWAPPKVPHQFLEGHGFVSSTLPTLVGDLALNPAPPPPKTRKKMDSFLSVSQLVEGKAKGRRRPLAEPLKQVRGSAYSAEALIGGQHKPPAAPFASDSGPYFPPVQEPGYQNQSAFDAFNFEYAPERAKRPAKKRPPAENVLPSFDMHFFNSPTVLPDDFHTTYLPPTTGARSFVPPPQGGTTLTNFNLSTIFPEINKVRAHSPNWRVADFFRGFRALARRALARREPKASRGPSFELGSFRRRKISVK